jgi:hypothetical protein
MILYGLQSYVNAFADIICPDALDAAWNVNSFELAAINEGTVPYSLQAVRECHAFQV